MSIRAREHAQALLGRSGQLWKIRVLGSMALIGVVLIVLAVAKDLEPPLWMTVHFVGVALGAGSVLWGVLSIRCPGCGARLYWMAIRGRSPIEWLDWLRQLDTCPTCGNDGSPACSTPRV
jgi:hypothetical protein